MVLGEKGDGLDRLAIVDSELVAKGVDGASSYVLSISELRAVYARVYLVHSLPGYFRLTHRVTFTPQSYALLRLNLSARTHCFFEGHQLTKPGFTSLLLFKCLSD